MPSELKRSVSLAMTAAFFATLAFAGIAICVLAVRDFAHARDSRFWTKVDGVVLSPKSERPSQMRYAYVAGGRTHESSRAKFATAAFGASALDRSPGERIDVLVNPDDPELAVISPGGSSVIFAGVATISVALVFFGVGGLVRTVLIGHPELHT